MILSVVLRLRSWACDFDDGQVMIVHGKSVWLTNLRNISLCALIILNKRLQQLPVSYHLKPSTSYRMLNVNFSKNQYTLLYEMYTRFQSSYYNRESQPFLTFEFQLKAPIILVDLSYQ